MTDHNTTMRDDIAFMRALAEEGGRAQPGRGAILVAAGLIYAAASLVSWSVFQFRWTHNGLVFPIAWFGGAALFMLILRGLRSRAATGGAATGVAWRGAGAAWAGGGWAIFVLAVGMLIVGERTQAWWVMGVLGPIVTAVYGGCWMVAAALSRQRWLLGVGVGSFVMTGVLAWFVTDGGTMFLLLAASLLGLVALPGYALMRRARAGA